MSLRCLHHSIFIETPSLEGLPSKTKVDPSPHEMRLSPAEHQPSISWSRGIFIIIVIVIIIIIIIIIIIFIITFTIVIITIIITIIIIVTGYRADVSVVAPMFSNCFTQPDC